MWMTDRRTLMLWALLLDWLGQLLVVALIWSVPALTGIHLGGRSLYGQEAWFVLMLLLYPLLGWLFGSYTVLGWRRFTLLVLLQRHYAAVVTLLALVIARWLISEVIRYGYLTVMFGYFGSAAFRFGRRGTGWPTSRLLLPEAQGSLVRSVSRT